MGLGEYMAYEIVPFLNAEAVAFAGAELFRDRAKYSIKSRGFFRVALSGGSTPKRMFSILAEAPFHNTIEWDKVCLFWSDERSVPLDHPESNFKTAKDLLIDKVGLKPSNIHPMQAEPLETEGDLNYERAIALDFGVNQNGPPPAFDLIYLGMGPDAHTASLFPETNALAITDRWVVRNSVPKLSTTRLTFTFPLINAARCVCFLVCGLDKAKPLHEVLYGVPNRAQYPSQGIKPLGELLWYGDKAALSLIPEER